MLLKLKEVDLERTQERTRQTQERSQILPQRRQVEKKC
jgi:hypothetical protein